MDPVALTRALVDIDSTTGQEEEVGQWLEDYLRGLDLSVTTQPVDATRFNIFCAASRNVREQDVVLVLASEHQMWEQRPAAMVL